MLLPAASLSASQQPTEKPAPPPQAPAPQTPPASAPAPVVPPATGAPAPAPLVSRSFTAGCGMLMHPVRPERVMDFERFLDYFRDALARSTNPRVKSQASGWKFFKAAEPGPNGVVLYVFWLDPAVPGADYGMGPILAEVYTDPAQLNEIWGLYQGAVTTGGALLNFTPVPQGTPQPFVTPPVNAPVGQKPAAPATPPPAPVTTPAPLVPVRC